MSNLFEKNLKIELSRSVNNIVKLKQFDTLVLNVELYKDKVPVDVDSLNVEVRILKPDNTFIIQTKDITKVDNTITIKCIDDVTRLAGNAKLEIRLSKDDLVINTFDTILDVRASVLTGSVEASKNVITAVEELEQTIADAQEDINKIKACGNECFIISNWTKDNSSGFYQAYLEHNMNSMNVHVTIREHNSRKEVVPIVTVINNNKILIENDENVAIDVIMSASYYKPEVINEVNSFYYDIL